MGVVLTLDKIPVDTIFATGKIENSPEGIYMTDSDKGRMLLWAAKRRIEGWCIYIHWADMGLDYVLSNGDKVSSKENIQKLVPCSEEAFKQYIL